MCPGKSIEECPQCEGCMTSKGACPKRLWKLMSRATALRKFTASPNEGKALLVDWSSAGTRAATGKTRG